MLDRDAIAERYHRVRAQTEALAAPLSVEDMLVQSMPDASPTKWHLAHTTWFFAEFVLARCDAGYHFPDETWRVLFNSYYETVGSSHPRAARGLLSRPSLDAVRAWRKEVDDRMASLLARRETATATVLAATLLGTHHEQQHQELLLTDAKHMLFGQPGSPAYRASAARERALPEGGPASAPPLAFIAYDERVAQVGHDGDSFAYDNERPAHRAVVGPFLLASRLVTNGEYANFLGDGGYARPELWLADGWNAVQAGLCAPLYWERDGKGFRLFTLRGFERLDESAPVAHLTFFEADAYARWIGARLPTEEEWEVAAQRSPVAGNFVEYEILGPAAVSAADAESHARTGQPLQLFGDAWEWTSSAYAPYPRFVPLSGSLGEYNAKFMNGLRVLRGGSCLSPLDHLRLTYRNYFSPTTRWQMSGLRLARDA